MIPYLLAAVTYGTAIVLAEHVIGPKTNEVPAFAPLLLALNTLLPVGRARHHRRRRAHRGAHAELICRTLLAHYFFTVKCNTPKLWAELDALDRAKVPVQHQSSQNGHGRRERRTIQVIDAPGHIRNRFPHPHQVALIERYVRL